MMTNPILQAGGNAAHTHLHARACMHGKSSNSSSLQRLCRFSETKSQSQCHGVCPYNRALIRGSGYAAREVFHGARPEHGTYHDWARGPRAIRLFPEPSRLARPAR
jgi:hypothetical protein